VSEGACSLASSAVSAVNLLVSPTGIVYAGRGAKA
jgi:hypothetical protein